LDQAEDFLHLLLVDLGTLLRVQIEGIADGALLGPLRAALHELIVDLVLHKGTGPSTAALTHVEEQAKVSSLYGIVQIGIGQDNVGVYFP